MISMHGSSRVLNEIKKQPNLTIPKEEKKSEFFPICLAPKRRPNLWGSI